MEEKYAKDICDFFAKYNIASKFLRDGSLLKALLNDKINTTGIGLSTLLNVNGSYFTHDCKRKVPKDIIEIKPKDINWIYFILLYINRCPVCGGIKNSLSATTCSYACSNTHFRSGINSGNYIGSEDNYRAICFEHHSKKCIICGENKIVEVHHLDENPLNNSPNNLIPLCPTHHQYWHSRYKDLVYNKIMDYISKLEFGV